MESTFDWYQTTVLEQDPYENWLAEEFRKYCGDGYIWRGCSPVNGYKNGGTVRTPENEESIAKFYWGGNPWVNIKATGKHAPLLASFLSLDSSLCKFPHRPTRVDSCLDWDEPDRFNSMAQALMRFAVGSKIKVNQQGDWVRGEARTLYLGSRQSAQQLVLYEKGYEQGGLASLDWVRLEARVYPKKQSREMVSAWGANDVFSAGWFPAALAAVSGFVSMESKTISTVWTPADKARSRRALAKQYGRVIRQWQDEAGSPDAFMGELENEIARAAEASNRPVSTPKQVTYPDLVGAGGKMVFHEMHGDRCECSHCSTCSGCAECSPAFQVS